MITLEMAIDIAKSVNSKYNAYQEYKDAYEFFIDDGVLRIGGGDQGIVVDKKTGSVIRWEKYFLWNKKDVVKVGNPKRTE